MTIHPIVGFQKTLLIKIDLFLLGSILKFVAQILTIENSVATKQKSFPSRNHHLVSKSPALFPVIIIP